MFPASCSRVIDCNHHAQFHGLDGSLHRRNRLPREAVSHLGLSEAIGLEFRELKKDVDPDTVLDEIESSKQERE
jgi:hypothetical protein